MTEPEAALAGAPIWEKQVLELGLEWPEFPEFSDDEQWTASRLRVFLLTWDPFEWQPGRPDAFATSTTRGDDVGLVLYVPHWQVLDRPEGLSSWLGRLGESILSVGAEFRGAITDGSYPAGVQSGARPGLLSRVPGQAMLDAPVVRVEAAGWRPIQFDVLEDLAQDGFGPADLDRSPVRFSQPGEGKPGCPGCAGNAVGFPDGLKDAQEAICGPHRAEALRITTARLEASKASNPAGWEALLDAGQRLIEPHLPNGLGPRLVAASSSASASASPDTLAEAGATVLTAASLMEGLPDEQTALGGRLAPVRPWLQQLPARLAEAGLTDEAAQVERAAEELLTPPSAAAALAAAEEAAAAVAKPQPFRRESRVGRNQPCPCGSGKKYKFCHG